MFQKLTRVFFLCIFGYSVYVLTIILLHDLDEINNIVAGDVESTALFKQVIHGWMPSVAEILIPRAGFIGIVLQM